MSKELTILIDGESFEAPERKMTANELLALAELSSDEYYLVEIKGKKQNSFQDQGDTVINLHQKAKFISVFTGPTTVADGPITGAALFAAQLRKLGFDVTELPDGHVKFPYVVEVGKLKGTELNMGFVVPDDFSLTPPHGLHIDREIHPIGGEGAHPTGGIHASHPKHSKHFGSGWQHWSRPHPSWADSKRNAACYMAFIRQLWATQ